MRHFVRQSTKGRRVCAFNQYYKSKICDDVLKTLSEELKVEGIVYDIIEAYMKKKNEQFKIITEEYESKFDDHRRVDDEEKDKYINQKLGELPIHRFSQHLSLDVLIWYFDAVSLYPSARIDPETVYPRIQTGYTYTKDMND